LAFSQRFVLPTFIPGNLLLTLLESLLPDLLLWWNVITSAWATTAWATGPFGFIMPWLFSWQVEQRSCSF
jgi:hypothetical protein